MLVALPEEHQIQQCNVEKQTKGRLVHRCKLGGSGAKTIKPGLRIAACVHCKTLFKLEKLIHRASGTKGVCSPSLTTVLVYHLLSNGCISRTSKGMSSVLSTLVLMASRASSMF